VSRDFTSVPTMSWLWSKEDQHEPGKSRADDKRDQAGDTGGHSALRK
jgi:hypothetical protein